MLQDRKFLEDNHNIPCRDTSQGTETRGAPVRSLGASNARTVERGSPSGPANMFAAPLRASHAHTHAHLDSAPAPAPVERLRCADFVEKLRAYTQAKNFTKSSCHSKHVRTVIRDMIYDSLPIPSNPPRNQSTRDPEARRDSPERDHLSSGYHRSGRRERRSSPKRVANVQYLCDVTKCLTDTIKQLMDQSTSMTCPGQFLRRQLEFQQAPTSVQNPKPCDCCRATSNCNCGTNTVCTCTCKAKKLEAEISKWAETIPVYPNESVAKKNLRDNMIKELIETAKAYAEEMPREEFREKMREKATNMLSCLPMWLPEGEREREEFKKKLVVDLGEKLEKIAPTTSPSQADKENRSGNEGSYDNDSLTDEVMRGNAYDSGAGVSGMSGRGRRGLRNSTRNDGTSSPGGFSDSLSQDFDPSEFERTAEQEILDYTDPLVADKSGSARVKRQAMAKELARKAREILLEPEEERGQQDGMVRDELSQFFRKLSLDTLEPKDNLVKGLSEKLKRLAMSTPKKTGVGFAGRYPMSDDIEFDPSEFEKTAEQEILEYIEPLVDDKSKPARIKRQAMAKELARKAGDILLEPEEERGQQDDMVRDELSQFFRKLSLDTLEPKEILVKGLSEKLKRLAMSTPKKTRVPMRQAIEFDPSEFERTAEQEILEYIEPLVADKNKPARIKRQAMAKELARKARDILFEPEEDRGQKDGMVRDELSQFFRKLSLDTLEPKEKLVKGLSEKLKRLAMSATKKKDVGFAMRDLDDTTTSSIADDAEGEEEVREIIKQQKAAETQYLNKLEDVIGSWVDGLPVDLNKTVDGSKVKDSVRHNLAADVMDRQKYNQLHPKAKPTETEELDMLKYQIFKGLNDKLEQKDLANVIPQAEALMRKLKSVKPPDFSKFITAGAGGRPGPARANIVRPGADGYTEEGIAGPSGVTAGKYGTVAYPGEGVAGPSGYPGYPGAKVPSAPKSDAISGPGLSRIDEASGSGEIDGDVTFAGGSKNELFETVEKWVENLPIPSNTAEEKEDVDKLKRELANRLIAKVGGLHMDPNILNDDYTYQSIVADEIEQVLEDLPQTPEIAEKKEELKADLVNKFIEAQQKAKEEFAGHAFKQQLRDTVDKHLPTPDSVDQQAQAALEIIKDEIADALVNMAYEPDDNRREELQNNFDDKIQMYKEEIDKVNPGTVIELAKIKNDLVIGLKNIPVPNKEFIKAEVEQVRLKDEIKEWAKELPLKPDITPEEQLKANKMIALTAKRLHDIEREEQKHPNANYDRVKEREIGKLIKKLPLKQEEINVPEITEKLKERLKNTKEKREMKSDPRTSITSVSDDADGNKCQPCRIPPCFRNPCGFSPPYNPSPCVATPRQIPCNPTPCRPPHCTSRQTWFPRCTKPKHTSRNMSSNSPCRYVPKKHDCLNQKPSARQNCMASLTDETENTEESGPEERPRDRQHCMKPRSSADDEVERCPRCCGMSCPHPSHLFFGN